MKKEFCQQLGKKHVYIDKIYHRWQKAIQYISPTNKKFEVYLQSIQSNLLDLNTTNAPNKT